MLLAFISYKIQFTGRVSALINQGIELKMLTLHRDRLADIVLTPPEQDTPQGNLPFHDLAHLPATLELRKVSYAQHWWEAPPLGTLATEGNVVRFNENPFSDDQEWSVIRDVSNICPNYSDENLANYFAYALLLK
jgi:hypothetical protein